MHLGWNFFIFFFPGTLGEKTREWQQWGRRQESEQQWGVEAEGGERLVGQKSFTSQVSFSLACQVSSVEMGFFGLESSQLNTLVLLSVTLHR